MTTADATLPGRLHRQATELDKIGSPDEPLAVTESESHDLIAWVLEMRADKLGAREYAVAYEEVLRMAQARGLVVFGHRIEVI